MPAPRCPEPPARPSRGHWHAPRQGGRRRGRTSGCRRGLRVQAAGGSGERLRACAASRSGSTGSAAITVSHFGHSLLPTSIATGPPMVSPWRTPATIRTASCSNFMRAPRPWPRRRRASSVSTSAVVTATPAGKPSAMATSRGPCDSPAVNQRNMADSLPDPVESHQGRGPHRAGPPRSRGSPASCDGGWLEREDPRA